MKTVRLHKTGKRTEYDDASADWLVQHGYAELISETKKVAAPAAEKKSEKKDEVAAPAAPRRGRPPKAR